MRVSDDLFRLIKSLNKTEKAYFVKFSKAFSGSLQKNYLKLFDFIDSMEIYEEKRVLEKFRNEEFTRQISVAKNYLYNSILRSLKLYRRNEKKRDIAKELIEDAGVLMDKRLFRQAKKVLKRCRRISEEHEIYSQLLQVLVAESKISISEREYDEKNDRILENNYAERNRILDTIKNTFEFDLIEYRITSHLNRNRESKSAKHLSALRTIISGDILKDETNAISLTARLKFNHIHAAYHYAAGSLEESYKYLSREIEILSQKPQLLEDRLIDYYILLSNRLLILMELGKYEELETNIRQFRNELEKKEIAGKKSIRYYILNNSYQIEMVYRNRVGDFEEAVRLSEEYSSRLASAGFSMIKADDFWFINTLAHAYFGAGKYGDSLDTLNKILNDPLAEIRYNSIAHARVFSLIVHYELGNYDLMDYMIRSVYRYLLKNNMMHKFERLVFSFLKKLSDAVSENELKQRFSELQSTIVRFKKDESVKKALEYFDLISWLQSKISNATFAEVVRKRKSL